jgi:hypothetical protein
VAITPEGAKLVESTEFGMRFKNIILDFYEHDEDNEHVRPIAIFLIAWTALGHDIQHPPQTDTERLELEEFIDGHIAEVNAMTDKSLRGLLQHNTGGKAQ